MSGICISPLKDLKLVISYLNSFQILAVPINIVSEPFKLVNKQSFKESHDF